jgi:hypothetical protein
MRRNAALNPAKSYSLADDGRIHANLADGIDQEQLQLQIESRLSEPG